ncbi:1-acylglycerol-3-phosphate O-acyltransferase ABHD5-like isoform X2 [Anneissia japonica]|uniref:1-acylglycerol-3-phosphate O-acyltransferase ABHD5-like isoform X2 n=1 Tax=Anneissia japonica TaxID=1529436 RepID=UPI001425A9D7|nr:1-acylglycerol-3-phosphate O-acyltransferase ABHD5-like isoform X2 [Anneissia japonica]
MASAIQESPITDSLIVSSNDCDNGWFSGWLRWVPTSNEMLRAAEEQILGYLKNAYKGWFVTTKKGDRIRTIFMNNTNSQDKTPIVLVHGMGGGIGLWVQNLDALSNVRPVYAFDLLGFGRSTRRKFPAYPDDAEREFIDSIEEWREEVGLDKMILIGHSLGGFLSYAYGIQYPERVKHMVLVDPWGFPERDEQFEQTRNFPLWLRVVRTIMLTFNPLSGLRAAGPLGHYLVGRLRPDLDRKFSSVDNQNTISKYIYHCNVQRPTGEEGFKSLQVFLAWAHNPMINRIADLDKQVPLTVLYGSKSWMDSKMAYSIKYIRKDSQVNIKIVQGAGHHVYADKAESFNKIIQDVCRDIAD